MTQTKEGEAWIFGGISTNNKEILSDFWKLDTINLEWDHISQINSEVLIGEIDSYPQGRYGHVLSNYYDYVILFGGINSIGIFLNDLWIFDIKTKRWYQIK